MVYRIAAINGNLFAIERETPEEILPGDQIELKAGCNKDAGDCRYYNNLLRFGGAIVGGNHFRSLSNID